MAKRIYVRSDLWFGKGSYEFHATSWVGPFRNQRVAEGWSGDFVKVAHEAEVLALVDPCFRKGFLAFAIPPRPPREIFSFFCGIYHSHLQQEAPEFNPGGDDLS